MRALRGCYGHQGGEGSKEAGLGGIHGREGARRQERKAMAEGRRRCRHVGPARR